MANTCLSETVISTTALRGKKPATKTPPTIVKLLLHGFVIGFVIFVICISCPLSRITLRDTKSVPQRHLLELLQVSEAKSMQRRHSLEGMKFAQQEANNSDSQDFEGDPTESDPGYEVKMKMFEDRKIL